MPTAWNIQENFIMHGQKLAKRVLGGSRGGGGVQTADSQVLGWT